MPSEKTNKNNVLPKGGGGQGIFHKCRRSPARAPFVVQSTLEPSTIGHDYRVLIESTGRPSTRKKADHHQRAEWTVKAHRSCGPGRRCAAFDVAANASAFPAALKLCAVNALLCNFPNFPVGGHAYHDSRDATGSGRSHAKPTAAVTGQAGTS